MTTDTFQIPLEVAEVYESRFVPAIFAEWAPIILDAVGVEAGDRLLDVACGTGIVARTAHRAEVASVEVHGVDLNEGMLTVARRIEPGVTWHQSDVVALPFEAETFDAVTCQMAAMFFPDRRAAIADMARVLRPGGRISLVVPAALDEQPAYEPFVEAAVARTDESSAALLGAYWNCGDRVAFAADLEAAGLTDVRTRTRAGTARFASVADFVETEISATPLAERVSPEVRSGIVADVSTALSEYEEEGEDFAIPLVCNIVAAVKPG